MLPRMQQNRAQDATLRTREAGSQEKMVYLLQALHNSFMKKQTDQNKRQIRDMIRDKITSN